MDIRIARVADLPDHCHLNRWELLRYGSNPENIAVDLRASLDRDVPRERLALVLTATYTYMRGMIKRPLLEYAVVAEFEIPGMSAYVEFSPSRETVSVPPSLMNLMLCVAVGALRGMIARKTSGTPLENHPLPLINISSLVSKLIYGERADNRVVPLEEPVCG